MTYCVGIRVQRGLVLASDTRTTAAFDDVRVHGKMHIFEYPDRVFVIMSAGNLGTTQSVLARLQSEASEGEDAPGLRSVRHMYQAADHVAQTLVAVQAMAAQGAQQAGVSLEATLILGGQLRGEQPALYLIYPIGNWIATSPETPYVQIGESKYGKPILDRIIRPETTLEDAARCALVSLDSTARSNLSVGLPFDLAILKQGDRAVTHRMRLDADTPLYAEVRDTWSRKLENALHSLPRFDWEAAADDDA